MSFLGRRASVGPRGTAARLVCCQALALGLCLLTAGCVTKGAARQRELTAFEAGKAEALAAMQRQSTPGVTVLGDVREHVVPWTEGLRLSQAITAAGYTGMRDPRSIIVVRAGERVAIDVRKFMRGLAGDPELLAGDVVEIQR